MPRIRRAIPPHSVLHVVNRGNDRRALFRGPDNYDDFLHLVERTLRQVPLRVLAYALMPNHWHFVVWPAHAKELSQFMHRVTAAHAARVRYETGTIGLGHVYQNRFRAFAIEQDERYVQTVRYVEANPLRARLVDRAEKWKWSSLSERLTSPRLVVDGPIPLPPPASWCELVNISTAPPHEGAGRAPVPRPGTGPFRIS